MCRNIRTLFNFDPPATEIEIRDASLQFVRKLSGFSVPSKANEEAFERAVAEVAATADRGARHHRAATQSRSRGSQGSRTVGDPVRTAQLSLSRAYLRVGGKPGIGKIDRKAHV